MRVLWCTMCLQNNRKLSSSIKWQMIALEFFFFQKEMPTVTAIAFGKSGIFFSTWLLPGTLPHILVMRWLDIPACRPCHVLPLDVTCSSNSDWWRLRNVPACTYSLIWLAKIGPILLLDRHPACVSIWVHYISTHCFIIYRGEKNNHELKNGIM